MKIVVLDGYALNPGDLSWQGFEELGEVTVYDRTSYTDKQEIIERIGDAEAILTNKTPITADVLKACPQLTYIGVLATGYNVVDLAAAKEQGITVTNIPSYSTNAVAQATFALLLEVTNQVGHHNRSVHQGDWQTSKDFSYWQTPLMELAGKTIGLIGYGAIAQAVATIAHAFQLKVIYFNHRPKPAQADWAKQVSLAELYQEADIISLHVPQFPETEKMIDRTALAQMKSSAILINTARGGLIDEGAVAEALQTGQIAALAADVVSKEPIAADNPLLQAPNCYLTPHIAWAPVETRRRLMGIAVANLSGFKAGTPQNVV
ncbi:MAG: D-2-hydroxyacid dehydrogenase [Enterococcus casseliflavus]|jgi:glycerate dehydrogenase|uniref:D-2-hydroxyacid dehydrogenase n=1 Tax=Enterococcus casseliflavus TaxID=37734 RepID=A0ABD5FHB4_ENTCA|nr:MULTISPECIES: D-2-hydroxyacid dehydrogenase [Enterococcus]EEV28507.1 2-hydroxyacid dehydrogenase [Enterococcus casseliflavus EC30]EEV34844.1 2-hydroxyacid dehydrogenase [Enterococcus casseliflavus EC10]MBO6384076.1 D-2-hydroxyacid dehydrogenase [Enterococcus casseliflavus]MDR3826187.1 D-2-hydroxyacid dehydrogenase [Enterococcus sp.]MDT2981267.1 D-2-hydroxyacid dehydrogenase [Enterococcus casseliflavus]